MRYKKLFQILAIGLILKASMVWGAQEFNTAVSDATITILKELKYSNKLSGRRIAIYDFRDAETGEFCKPLTVALDEKVTAVVHQIKNFNDGEFTVVARRDLGAMENEYLISKGGAVVGYQGVIDLMEPSDILITGVWQNGDMGFTVTLKALEVQRRGSRLLTSKQVTIKKFGLPNALLDCLKTSGGGSSNPSAPIRALQDEIAHLDRQIENIRQQRQTEAQKRSMIQAIEEKKRVIDQLQRKTSPKGTVPYTSRVYDENLAFLNVSTEPEGLDVYIDGAWVGKAPIKMYEIEAGMNHTIEAKGDPRYFIDAGIKRRYDRFERREETLAITRGAGRILLLAESVINRVSVNDQNVNFDPNKPVIEVPAGDVKVHVVAGNKVGRFEQDVWTGDLLRKDVKLTNRFSADTSKGIVVDHMTGLIWAAETSPNELNWEEAKRYCANLEIGGYTDWRLPTIDELRTIVDKSRGNPAINTDFFPDTKSSSYWSSTTNANDTNRAWYIYFRDGLDNYYYKSYYGYVRAVRGGQYR